MLYCANPVLDLEVRRQLGDAITSQLNDSRVQNIRGNPLPPDLKLCKVLTSYGAGDIDEGVRVPCANVVRASRYLAADANVVIDRRKASLSRDLVCGARYSIVLPPAARAAGFAIRVHSRIPRPLSDYMSLAQIRAVVEFMRKGANIIVAGAVDSGKTTLLRSLLELVLEEIAGTDSCALIEDAAELRVEGPNMISWLAGRDGDNLKTYQQHIHDLLRHNIKRSVIGEIRGPEALDLIEAWNVGMRGNFVTIHADSARDVLTRFEILIERAGGNPARIRERLASVIGLVIYIQQLENGERRVTEMVTVGWSNDGYQFTEVGK